MWGHFLPQVREGTFSPSSSSPSAVLFTLNYSSSHRIALLSCGKYTDTTPQGCGMQRKDLSKLMGGLFSLSLLYHTHLWPVRLVSFSSSSALLLHSRCLVLKKERKRMNGRSTDGLISWFEFLVRASADREMRKRVIHVPTAAFYLCVCCVCVCLPVACFVVACQSAHITRRGGE